MNTTSFTGVPVDTPQYRKIMNMVGRCLRGGGYVDYRHDQKMVRNMWGLMESCDTVDVTLHWQ